MRKPLSSKDVPDKNKHHLLVGYVIRRSWRVGDDKEQTWFVCLLWLAAEIADNHLAVSVDCLRWNKGLFWFCSQIGLWVFRVENLFTLLFVRGLHLAVVGVLATMLKSLYFPPLLLFPMAFTISIYCFNRCAHLTPMLWLFRNLWMILLWYV